MHRFSWLANMGVGKVLEIGCGDGITFRNNKKVDWTGVDDLSEIEDRYAGDPEKIEQEKQRIRDLMKDRKFIEVDAMDMLPIPEVSQDTLVLGDVLEHTPDPYAFLMHMIRYVKPGGRILISIPDEYSWNWRVGPFRNTDHIYNFNYITARALVKRTNLEIKLFYHTQMPENNGFVFYYIILKNVTRKTPHNWSDATAI